MRSISFLAAVSLLILGQPRLTHGQQCSARNMEVILLCQGLGDCAKKTWPVLAAEPGGGQFGTVLTVASCGYDDEGNQCFVSFSYASGACVSGALNKPSILQNLGRLARTSPIPILVASCAGGLVEFHPRQASGIKIPERLDVDRKLLRESISPKNQGYSGE